MYIKTIIKLNAKAGLEHEFANNDLAIIDGKYHMFENGVFYTEHFSLEPNRLGEDRNAYVVPQTIIDDPTTVEHTVFNNLLPLAITQDNARNGKKIKANKPGHVYIARNGTSYLYLGNAKVLDTESLTGISGHAYFELRFAGFREMAYPVMDHFLRDSFSSAKNKLVISVDGDTLNSARGSTSVVVQKNPKTMAIDVGYFAEANQIIARGTDIRVESNEIHVSNYAMPDYEGNRDFIIAVVPQ